MADLAPVGQLTLPGFPPLDRPRLDVNRLLAILWESNGLVPLDGRRIEDVPTRGYL